MARYPEKVFFNGFDEIYLSVLSAGATATIGTTVDLQPESFIAVRDAFLMTRWRLWSDARAFNLQNTWQDVI